jgi:retron-type reverse transcriptase
LFYLNANNAPSNANSNIGCRLAMEDWARSGAATAAPTVPHPSGAPSCPVRDEHQPGGAAGKVPVASPTLFERITAWDNLVAAYREARKGKRRSPEVAAFDADAFANLVNIHEHLLRGTWQPGQARRFWVRDPKWREITAPPFEDRIVHHAIVRVIEPLFERRFIFDSYACRRGKGTHAAVRRTQSFLRGAVRTWTRPYIVKVDVKSYFASIDHDVLLRQMSRVVRDDRVLALLRTVYGGYGFSGVGLPVGALTSQLAANILLDVVDHKVKDDLGVRYYVRYMDDMVAVVSGKNAARSLLERIALELAALGLRMNPKSGYWPLKRGVDFCGYRIWTTHIRPRRRAIRTWKARFRRLAALYARGRVRLCRCREAVMSFLAVMRHANAAVTTKNMLNHFVLRSVSC